MGFTAFIMLLTCAITINHVNSHLHTHIQTMGSVMTRQKAKPIIKQSTTVLYTRPLTVILFKVHLNNSAKINQLQIRNYLELDNNMLTNSG